MQRFIGKIVGLIPPNGTKVLVERKLLHPRIPKMQTKRSEFHAIDEKAECVVGDTVAIQSCKKVDGMPFKVLSVLKAARRFVHPRTNELYTCE
jgi:ribosomal protein S17